MNTLWYLVNLFVFTQLVVCRDFYLGMFRRNDFLVAQDVIYKASAPFGYTTASYGRFFKCPITYFRVVDRLGQGRGPFTTIVRGGLRKKFIIVRIKSTYRLPVSVNIYVGCENKQPSTFKRTTRILTSIPITTNAVEDDADDSKGTTITDSGIDTAIGSDATTLGEGGTTGAESETGDVTIGDTGQGTTELGNAADTTPESGAEAETEPAPE